MKKALRDSHGIFGGELSGHFYYRDNYCADSGMITFVHMLNIISQGSSKVSGLIKPLRRYFPSGEINFQIEDKKAKMEELAKRYRDGQVDSLDGVTVGYKDWWFNCRPSNTEPLLRLTVEAKTAELLDEKLKEIESVLGPPARHEKPEPAEEKMPVEEITKEKKVTKEKKIASEKKVAKEKKIAKEKKVIVAKKIAKDKKITGKKKIVKKKKK
jgi:hypothetical protein